MKKSIVVKSETLVLDEKKYIVNTITGYVDKNEVICIKNGVYTFNMDKYQLQMSTTLSGNNLELARLQAEVMIEVFNEMDELVVIPKEREETNEVERFFKVLE
jgi:hypothetical protein